ncbi:11249_t:CDS:2 [Dentiscutata erythropus]|uniref:11249_t:CDS:1 n=1 Tax=Dentiscutata erythropus TaxID=1348616 RepID=A0A9N8YUT8_9GLOM|nr:11249_t:CDS:2 [Dentiscutata erythropus]
MFTPRIEEDETVNNYLDLIYEPLVLEDNLENDDNSDSIACMLQFRQWMKNTHGYSRG